MYVSGMASGRRPLTQELYDSLVIAFREAPGNVSFAARRALCSRQLAKRLWDGRPYRDYPWAKPISFVLEEEKIAAMARARELARQDAQAKEAERAKATQEAIEAQAQETQILRVARGDVLSALALAASLVPAMKTATAVINKALEVGQDGKLPTLSVKDAMTLMTRHTQLIQRAVGAAEAVIQLSRLDRGASTANVAIAKAEDLSLDQALEELEALEEVLSQARGALRPTIVHTEPASRPSRGGKSALAASRALPPAAAE